MKWEYKIIGFSAEQWIPAGLPSDIGQRFDEWGEDGWELVRVEPILRGGWFFLGFGSFTRTTSFVAYFKRPKQAN